VCVTLSLLTFVDDPPFRRDSSDEQHYDEPVIFGMLCVIIRALDERPSIGMNESSFWVRDRRLEDDQKLKRKRYTCVHL
jgi:hypothetical protein